MGNTEDLKEIVRGIVEDIESEKVEEERKKNINYMTKRNKMLNSAKYSAIVPLIITIYFTVKVFIDGLAGHIMAYVPTIMFLAITIHMFIMFKIEIYESNKVIKGEK